MNNEIEIKNIENAENLRLASFGSRIQAGFPSPAQDLFGDTFDLYSELIRTPEATFCARVTGNSMIESGINEGDILIIDKSLTPHDGCIAVCFVDGDFTVKKIAIRNDAIFLVQSNPAFPAIRISEENNFQVWGVVSHIIKNVLR